MGKPSPHRMLLAGLGAALVGLVVSVVLVAGAWPGGSDAGDFGAMPGGSDSGASAPAREAVPEGPAGDGAAPSATAVPGRVPGPRSLSLPRLGVRAPVDPVGVADDGQVEVPDDPRRVGWYRFSPAPGEPSGSSVVVGHVDSDGRGLGVLVALADVRQGDRVLVRRADGSSVEYRVAARRSVAKQDLAASEAFRRDGPGVLTLITCAGPYLPDRGGYQRNLVVTAAEAPE
ncbi:class F sortase [Streptomyces sp. NPDC002701]|uniref:class F sortase n=1 Tax=Streptomyces sp. NPDC002701 TaxID=3364661 RepID=UPI0036BCF1EE